MPSQRPSLDPAVLVEFAEVRHRPTRTLRTRRHVRCTLPSFLQIVWRRYMRPRTTFGTKKEMPKVGTTCSNQARAPSNPLIRLTPPYAKWQKPVPNCSSWVSSKLNTYRAGFARGPRRAPTSAELPAGRPTPKVDGKKTASCVAGGKPGGRAEIKRVRSASARPFAPLPMIGATCCRRAGQIIINMDGRCCTCWARSRIC